MEKWEWVPEYEGRYQISDQGRVRSFLFSKTGRLMNLDADSNGYVRVHFQFKKTWLLHRLVATVFLPNPLSLPAVNHVDGNKRNNVASNLAWVSHGENMRHSWRHLETYKNRVAMSPRGEENRNAKLRAEDVLAIRAAYTNGGVSYSQLAGQFGVTKNNIGAIVRKQNWKHI